MQTNRFSSESTDKSSSFWFSFHHFLFWSELFGSVDLNTGTVEEYTLLCLCVDLYLVSKTFQRRPQDQQSQNKLQSSSTEQRLPRPLQKNMHNSCKTWMSVEVVGVCKCSFLTLNGCLENSSIEKISKSRPVKDTSCLVPCFPVSRATQHATATSTNEYSILNEGMGWVKTRWRIFSFDKTI